MATRSIYRAVFVQHTRQSGLLRIRQNSPALQVCGLFIVVVYGMQHVILIFCVAEFSHTAGIVIFV